MGRPKNDDFLKLFIADDNTGCWNWIGPKYGKGYGSITTGGKQYSAHFYSYLVFYGSIPEGLIIDHTCHNRKCVNPLHLEAITQQENVKRGMISNLNRLRAERRTHCNNGHEWIEENTITREDGRKRCRICKNIAQNNLRALKRNTE